MARVFVATDNALGRRVVVKVLPPDLAAGISVDRFRREIRVAAGLHHPNILPVHSAGEAGGILYYTMPWVEGESLRARLSKSGALPVNDAIHILRDLAKAIAHAHRHGVVHRDIKPENILLEDNTGLVADFGIAKAIGESVTSEGSDLTSANIALGTPAYMGPEQAAGDPHVDQRADIYAFGAVGYELLAGEPPFGHRSPQQILAAQIAEEPTPLEQRRPGIPPAIAAFIMRCLAKHPADRWQSGDVLVQQLDALDTGSTAIRQPARATEKRQWVRVALGFAAVVVIGGIAALWSLRRSPTLDRNLVAVTPFDVLDPKGELWHEGMVDLLSRNLDGVGPLRTVAPTTVIRRWTGRADPASAEELAQKTGAAFVVYGTVLAGTGDSVRVRATLLDVASHRSLGEYEVENASERMVELTDSLSAQLIRGLSQVRPVASVRLTSFGTRSLPAIKAFLRGEQYFRHTQWDSALGQYRAAVALDSDFVLALNRSSSVYGWIGGFGDSASTSLALRAGALNHGLAPRESLLVAADSLFASLTVDPGDEVWDRRQRMFATLNTATRRYPEDPEVWYSLADARVHMGANLDPPMSDGQILALFDRAIALDSSYTPAYIHPIALGLELGGAALGTRYLTAYLAHNPPGQRADGLALLPSLLDPSRAHLPEVEAALNSLSPEGYADLIEATNPWPDTAETAVRVARAELAQARLRPAGDPLDSSIAAIDLASELIRRGHFTEAITLTRHQRRRGPLYAPLGAGATLGIIGGDTSAADLGATLQSGARGGGLGQAMPWWAAVGDTASLARAKAISDSLVRTPTVPSRRRVLAATHAAVAPGYMALARRDTAAALRVFEAYPEEHCTFCEVEPLYKARVLAARGREREALTVLDRFQLMAPTPWAEVAMLDRGRIAEHLGDKPKAIDSYLVVAEFWRHADPALQPVVREADDALRRLSGDAPRTRP